MGTTVYLTFGYKLTPGQYFDPGYDPFQTDHPPEVNESVYSTVEEGVYYYTAGMTDGRSGMASREGLIPAAFVTNYRQGWEDGSWQYKIFHYTI